ncbi:MAG: LamG domain-containing protein, partial [Victivallales bacterium]|nr:LamG domain-containing protein [Victivallales bacterium]
ATGCGRRQTRMWESGRIAQHFDFLDLAFKDDTGEPLGCYGTLDMVAWPGSLTFTAEMAPDQLYVDGPVVGVAGNGLCIVKKPYDVPHRPELEPEQLTVECWIKIPEKMGRKSYGWLVCKNDNEWGQGNYGLMFRRGTVFAVLNNAGGRNQQEMIGQRGRFPAGKWVHLAMTFDGKTMAFYMDGRQQGKKTIDKVRVPGKGRLRIGQRSDGNFDVVNGLYDQVRVWSRALTGKELRAHTLKPGTIKDRSGLVLAQDFDSGGTAATPVWRDAKLRIGLTGGGQKWQDELRVAGPWKMGDKKRLGLTCNFADQRAADRKVAIQISTPGGQTFPVGFDATKDCHVADVKGLKRSFGGGWKKITDYDEFDIVL